MTHIRPPAVAGSFYPAEAHRLEKMVKGFMETAVSAHTPPAKAIIAPHAGYIYSGPVAASAYGTITEGFSRVILIGPAHRFAVRGLATVSYTVFRTPMGFVSVDREAIRGLRLLPQVQILDEAHEQEHGLEVHLPFLQTLMPGFSIVPLVVGQATGEEVAEVLQTVWQGDKTLVVISSDLSHYYDYDTARQLDQATAQAIETFRPQAIHREHACGRIAIQGLLLAARQRGLKAKTVDLRNSGDMAGPRDRVVGYGAFTFFV